MENRILDFSSFLEESGSGVTVPSVALAHSSTPKSFQEIFCVNEVAVTEYPKICFGADPLLLMLGKERNEVVGKGLNNSISQCVMTVKRKKDIFLYQTGNFFENESVRKLDEECMMIFLKDAAEVYFLQKDDSASGKKLFRLEDDVEICLYLETDLLNGRNGYYACLVRDMTCGLNVCTVTADARSAEVYMRFFLVMSGMGGEN